MKLLFLPLALIFACVSIGAFGYAFTTFMDWTFSFDNENLGDAVYAAGFPIFAAVVFLVLFGTAFLIYLAFT